MAPFFEGGNFVAFIAKMPIKGLGEEELRTTGKFVNPYFSGKSGVNATGVQYSGKVDSGGDSVSYAGALNSAADAIDTLSSIANANSAKSADEARILREWQEEQNAKAMQFSEKQAALNRDWQKMMSDTAHQREIADLKAAGLNPVLSAMGGNGAAVTSGATASGVTSAGAKGEVDMSMNSALVSLLAAVYNRTTQIEAANINARTQEAVADKYNATSEIVAQLTAAASKYGADASYAASKYGTDVNKYLHENYPSNLYQAIPAIISAISGDSPRGSISGVSNSLKNAIASIFKKGGSFSSGFGASRK